VVGVRHEVALSLRDALVINATQARERRAGGHRGAHYHDRRLPGERRQGDASEQLPDQHQLSGRKGGSADGNRDAA
jgi:hypothetical protein